MNVLVIRPDGTEETHVIGNTQYAKLRDLIEAESMDTVNLRNGQTMFVDDDGHQKGLPDNVKATALYHGVCRAGTTHRILGPVAIVPAS